MVLIMLQPPVLLAMRDYVEDMAHGCMVVVCAACNQVTWHACKDLPMRIVLRRARCRASLPSRPGTGEVKLATLSSLSALLCYCSQTAYK